MAAIGNIRKDSTFLVIVIGVALAAFVLGDFAKGGGGSRNINVGEIEGEEVTIMDFNFEAERNINATMEQQQKDRLSVDEIFSVKDQTWNDIVHRTIMDNEYEEIGLTVTSDELFDLVQGPNPHALIKQYFTDPNTKQYDRNMVVQLVLIWAVAIFGFQILLKIIEKPTPEPAYLVYETYWDDIQAANMEIINLQSVGQSALSVLGKVAIDPEHRKALDNAVSWMAYNLADSSQKVSLKAQISDFEALTLSASIITDEKYVASKNALVHIVSDLFVRITKQLKYYTIINP